MLVENKQPLGLQTVITIFWCLTEINIKAPYIVETGPMQGLWHLKVCDFGFFGFFFFWSRCTNFSRCLSSELTKRYISVTGTRCVCSTHELQLLQHKDVLCSIVTTRVLQPSFWGFDYILWVLIVTDLACWWLHFIWGKKGPVLPPDWAILADQRGCLLTSTFTGQWGTRLKFILPLGGMVLSLPPPVRWGQLLPSPLALQLLCETT